MTAAISLSEKLTTFSDHSSPNVVSTFNGHEIMVVKVKRAFNWHSHPDSDDFFYVLKGHLAIELRDGAVKLGPGDLYIVPKGVEHRPFAEEEVHMMLIEPAGMPNTGDAATAAVKETI